MPKGWGAAKNPAKEGTRVADVGRIAIAGAATAGEVEIILWNDEIDCSRWMEMRELPWQGRLKSVYE